MTILVYLSHVAQEALLFVIQPFATTAAPLHDRAGVLTLLVALPVVLATEGLGDGTVCMGAAVWIIVAYFVLSGGY